MNFAQPAGAGRGVGHHGDLLVVRVTAWFSDQDESERVVWFTLPEVRKLLAEGQIPDGPGLTAISLYLVLET